MWVIMMLASKGKALPYIPIVLAVGALFYALNTDIFRFSKDTISIVPMFNPIEKKDVLNIVDIKKVYYRPIGFGPRAGLNFKLKNGEYGTLSFLWKRERRLLIKELESRGIEVIDYSEY